MKQHVVRRGESLSSIAGRYGFSWQEVASINGLRNPDRLRVGQSLQLPLKRDGVAEPRSSPRPTMPQREPSRGGGHATAVAGDVTDAQMRAIMPNAGTRIARYIGPLNAAMRAHDINTNERRAAFLAQISVESGELRHVEENLNYSASRLRAVWPRRFRTQEVADNYAHNPEALANYVYADRLGNGGVESGDGYRFRGRGLMQTTVRDNYRAAGFESNPDALSDPQTAADSAGRFWSQNGLNARTNAELNRTQFNSVSQTVNGGNHGSDERWSAYRRALRALQPVSSE
ncbi:LysM peptidoglycan-binding domain-containing protein [Sphingomonas sanguinis]|uniref:LysM peptidoglycan-binding domain-containing protein n=2 Tax=Sphingomonas sanguinis TaxID=33051 RepID=A0A7Y7UQW9_9SPHN|nr:LysM peptidoglycan-binding domain-containing protein [Sphingomonas sanguinis]NVP31409.1 LysM peptidoglycan-binding domain-containing protein [Sphingomonas sanguinis]